MLRFEKYQLCVFIHGSAGRQPLAVGKQLATAGSCVGDTHVPVDGRDASAADALELASSVDDGPGAASSDSSRRRRTAASSVTGGWREGEGCAVEWAAGGAMVLADADAGEGADGVEMETGDW